MKGIIRPRDLALQGIAPVYLRRLHRRGLLVQSGRGVYMLPHRDLTENHSLAEACKRVPHGAVCLLSALRDYRRRRRAGLDEVWRFARVCRVAQVMRPYLEALA